MPTSSAQLGSDSAARSGPPGHLRAKLLQRVISLLLGMVMIFTVMIERRAPAWQFVAPVLIFVALLVYRFKARSFGSRRYDRAEMLVEHFLAGLATSTLVAFNALPSVLGFVFMAATSLSVGGVRLLLAGTASHALGIAAGLALSGLVWLPMTSMTVFIGALPLLIVHPLMVARVTGDAFREAARKQAQLETMTRRDGLTGLYNRTWWESLVRNEFATCNRSNVAGCVVLIDLDHFKLVNDMHGHAAGDAVIRGFAALLSSHVREIDACGRYGGEEFGLLLPLTSAPAARVLIERLRESLRAQPLWPQLTVTASFGIAEWAPDIDTHETWMRLADQMLYRAKHLGRDRVCTLGDGGERETTPVKHAVASIPTPSTGSPILRDPAALRFLLAGLQNCDSPMALFNPSDQLALANPAFLELYHVPAGSPSFGDIIRHCHANQLGPRIETDDIDAWLRVAESKRLSKPRRGFAVDMLDGRWFWIAETSFEHGWLLLSMIDITASYKPQSALAASVSA